MAVVFLIAGIVFGALGAGVALWHGASLLLALALYSVTGSFGALAVILIVWRIGEARADRAAWAAAAKEPGGALSA